MARLNANGSDAAQPFDSEQCHGRDIASDEFKRLTRSYTLRGSLYFI
ncbi:hypothetical protein VCR20J5_640071 [Vibrio crassostreae]|nr:hypothetical protein VCR9J2_730005 [Vibrio crassostreae]CDT54311.1 hypothetical protein VCR20J5_640071 [Vibrio crassostreae]CDT58610.1 hypothetical protein VCR15J5_680101 [Vibrio crassostreae]